MARPCPSQDIRVKQGVPSAAPVGRPWPPGRDGGPAPTLRSPTAPPTTLPTTLPTALPAAPGRGVAVRDGGVEVRMAERGLSDAAVQEWCCWARQALPGFARSGAGALVILEADFSNNLFGDRGVLTLLRLFYALGAGVGTLKLFRNRIGRAGAEALADWILHAPTPLCELHLSHNYIPSPGARRLLEAAARRPDFPPERPSLGKVPLWLRLESNLIRDPDALILAAEDKMRSVRGEGRLLCVVQDWSQGCRNSRCGRAQGADECPIVHLTYPSRQHNEIAPTEARAWNGLCAAQEEAARWGVRQRLAAGAAGTGESSTPVTDMTSPGQAGFGMPPPPLPPPPVEGEATPPPTAVPPIRCKASRGASTPGGGGGRSPVPLVIEDTAGPVPQGYKTDRLQPPPPPGPSPAFRAERLVLRADASRGTPRPARAEAAEASPWAIVAQERRDVPSVAGKGGGKGKKGGKGYTRQEQGIRRALGDALHYGTLATWQANGLRITYGWIAPEGCFDDPDLRLHQGQIFVSQDDADLPVSPGTRVSFQLYRDNLGLGALDMRTCPPPPPPLALEYDV